MNTAASAGTTPVLSVVVASWGDEALLARCLESLGGPRDDVEVIVATNLDDAALQRAATRFPFIRGVSISRATVFRLRAVGAAMARGALVALIEDHVTVSRSWASSLIAAHRDGHGVLGGPVDNGLVSRAFDWALYFVEYGAYMPPTPGGTVLAVSGVNVAYDRALLDACRATWRETLQENEVNDALRVKGHAPYMVSSAIVSTHLPMTLRESMSHLYGGGRHYGRYRARSSPWWKRPLWIVVSPAVPCVLFARIARRVASRAPSRFRQLLRGAGYFALLVGSWSVGELAGYASATPGVRSGARA